MPEKHPNTVRWGGPGASHEDATKPMPEAPPARPEGPEVSNPRVSQVSGGGGEPDEKHSHVDGMRSSKSHATDSPSPTSTRDWRPNRSRSDIERERRQEEEAGQEQRTFDADDADDAVDAAGPPGSERGVQVLVNTDNNLPGTESVAEQVEQAVRKGLRRFESHITHVEVFLADENASKSGPGDKRCSIEARPRGADPVAASDRGASIDEAVSAALGRLVRVLDKEIGKRRDHKGGESVRGSF